VGAPADDTGNREHRSIEFQRKIKHTVYETAVEIHIGTDALVDAALFGDHFRRESLYQRVETVILHPSFFFRQALHKTLQHFRPGVGNRIDRVSHTVDQAAAVERFFVEQLLQIRSHLVLIIPVMYRVLHIVKHTDNFNIRAAVLRSL